MTNSKNIRNALQAMLQTASRCGYETIILFHGKSDPQTEALIEEFLVETLAEFEEYLEARDNGNHNNGFYLPKDLKVKGKYEALYDIETIVYHVQNLPDLLNSFQSW